MQRLLTILLSAIVLGATCPAESVAQGTLRVGVGTSLSQLDPAKATIGDEFVYTHLVFSGLTWINQDMVVKPDLAVSWTPSDDLKTWTFKLREGVKFHNGRLLDSEDVVATMKRILDPATGSRARTNLGIVEKVEAVDPLTVRFTLNIPYAGFADIFADRQMKIVAKDQITELSTKPIGTGPFVFKSWTPGDRLEVVKNPDYYEKGLPKLDAVTIRIIPEAVAGVAALESNAIDLLWSLPYESVAKFKSHPTVRVDSVATPTWDGVIMNNEKPPFTDIRVRQALAATIDKEALVELALFGQGSPTFSPIPPSHPYFNKSLKFKAPDIALAKKLLTEAGFPNGFDVTMQVPQEREQRVRLGVAVRDMAQRAGIRIKLERVTFASYASQVEGKETLYIDGFFARPTIDTSIYPFYHSTGAYNRQLWLYKEPRIDQLLDTARRTNDEDKRKELFGQLQAIADETVPSVLVYSAAHVNGVRKEVQNFRSTPMLWLELKDVSLQR